MCSIAKYSKFGGATALSQKIKVQITATPTHNFDPVYQRGKGNSRETFWRHRIETTVVPSLNIGCCQNRRLIMSDSVNMSVWQAISATKCVKSGLWPPPWNSPSKQPTQRYATKIEVFHQTHNHFGQFSQGDIRPLGLLLVLAKRFRIENSEIALDANPRAQ